MSASAATSPAHAISVNRCREPQSHVYLQVTERSVDSEKLDFTLGTDTEGLFRIALWGWHVLWYSFIFSTKLISAT